jgi:hypothetical protein
MSSTRKRLKLAMGAGRFFCALVLVEAVERDRRTSAAQTNRTRWYPGA